MTTTSSSLGSVLDNRNNPLMREIEDASPAMELFLVTGYDSEEWPIYDRFSVGERVGYTGHLWSIVGFTTDNKIVIRPLFQTYGDNRIVPVAVILLPQAAECLVKDGFEAGEISRHKNGLVTFGS